MSVGTGMVTYEPRESKIMQWPVGANPALNNPIEIENFLRATIRNSHVSLIGEIDLASPTDYASIGWSLLDFANYQMEQGAVKDFLSSKPNNRKFRATIAIWSVAHAQISDEGGRLWDQLADFSSVQKANLAQEFTDSIAILRFDTFEEELMDAQKHVQLASMHALLPDFSIRRYAEILEIGVRLNRPKHIIAEEIIHDPSVSKAVKRLFRARPEMALDLIERTFNYVAYGYDLDLPPRIISRLRQDRPIFDGSGLRESFPRVRFFESDRRPIIMGGAGWKFLNSANNEVNFDKFQPEKIIASKENFDQITLFNPNHGYLIFDDRGNLIHGLKLPEVAGFILWRGGTQFHSELPNLDPRYLLGDGWDGWQYSYIHDVRNLEIVTTNQDVITLVRPIRVEIELFPVRYLLDSKQKPVFSEFPKLASGESARATDHLHGRQYRVKMGESILGDLKSGKIDVTITGGLGKSTRIKGTVLPGIKISGLENALVKGEKREIQISAPTNWILHYPKEISGLNTGKLTITSHPELEIEIVELKDENGVGFTIYLEVPTLSWSVLFSGKEFQIMASETIFPIEDLKSIDSLILHGITEYLPILFIGEVPVIGKQRGQDAHYDLRFLAQDSADIETKLTIKWNYQDLTLIDFRPHQSVESSLAKRRPIVLKSLSELNNPDLLTAEANLFSIEEWNQYVSARQAEHILYRDQLRNRRSR